MPFPGIKKFNMRFFSKKFFSGDKKEIGNLLRIEMRLLVSIRTKKDLAVIFENFHKDPFLFLN